MIITNRKYFTNRWLLIAIFVAILIVPSGTNAYGDDYANRLYTPTFITKIAGINLIVDCWNHRIIYSRDIELPIKDWKTLDDDIAGPHSIASNGTIFVAEDTGRNRLFVYTLTPKGFKKTQIIDGIEGRPHRTVYDSATKKFYVLTSTTQNMFVLTVQNGKVIVDQKVHLEFLEEAYVRSFSIINGKMYFVSGPSKISVVDYINGDFTVEKQYSVPEEYSLMNDIKKLGDYYYISIYPEKIIRLKDLSNFNSVENIYSKLGFSGTPYFINYFDGRFFIPEIDSNSGIKSFKIKDNEIIDVKTLNDSGPPDDYVKKRLSELAT
ncbi:hypothetical protein RE628_20445 [Paenibacillus sp. D2_2]|uniref:hypothetical protein n=1 Tax=Paenibacillus sp. D2_2 TaxID=3073092 RepID=UPI002815DE03|nr:hypothetical protein [Paenibacillus sp. D2_2]WMT39741.1 hypothetical protein RE628_20445 [Paenibacillus sp. D2_2]